MEYNFHNHNLKAAYEEVRVVLEQPLYDINEVNADISQVEELLRNSRVLSFKVDPRDEYNKDQPVYPDICWNGEHLYYDSTIVKPAFYVKDSSNEYKFICHKYLYKILKEAKNKSLSMKTNRSPKPTK